MECVCISGGGGAGGTQQHLLLSIPSIYLRIFCSNLTGYQVVAKDVDTGAGIFHTPSLEVSFIF
jgi:hypothetical protein